MSEASDQAARPAARPSASAVPRITDAQVREIREAVRDALELSSLRILAVEIGVGHSTLHNFASGASPHPRVRRTLYDWFVARNAAPSPIHPSRLDALTEGLPDHVRRRLRPLLATVLKGGYVDGGVNVPAWLEAAAAARGPE